MTLCENLNIAGRLHFCSFSEPVNGFPTCRSDCLCSMVWGEM